MLADIDGLQVVGQAESGEESLIKARELKPDVVLMDVKMPGIGGLEATRKLLRSHPDIKVVAVTVCEEDPFPTRLLQAGAAGYLTKGAGLNEMVQASAWCSPGSATSARRLPSSWRSNPSSRLMSLPSTRYRSGKSRSP
ncbi:BarA-associated response regulator UvrY (= GacA = SirA) [Pseudomonas sp. SHC52]|nr:BarA-associated response regulator UvrY (= GacA = SirA) [Pseudomonas sp. SHC52]